MFLPTKNIILYSYRKVIYSRVSGLAVASVMKELIITSYVLTETSFIHRFESSCLNEMK